MSQHDLDTHSEAIQRIENRQLSISLDDQTPSVSYNLDGFMKLFTVPGLSVAVIDNFKIAWAKGYGVTSVTGSVPVSTDTMFQAASISKPVTAVAALQLIEQGILSLDEPVNDKLVSWHLPENNFTRGHPVTLRHLLTHTAGLNIIGFLGYEYSAPVPSVVQILAGESPANTEALTVATVPGSTWSYSGGGFTLLQQLLIDVTGKSFPDLMQEFVLDKAGMHHSTFAQPPPDSLQTKLAHGTFEDGSSVAHGYHIYPEMAAAGLWTTASDLAKLVIELALAKNGQSSTLLSPSMVDEMLRVQFKEPDNMGLGFELGDTTCPSIFGHLGGNAGFKSMLEMDYETGNGIAVLVNSDLGTRIEDFIKDTVAKEYHWKHNRKSSRLWIGIWIFLLASMKEKGITETLEILQKRLQEDPENYYLGENSLIEFAHHLKFTNRIFDAHEVLKVQVQLFPKYWFGFDALGDTCMMLGDEASALEQYKTSLALNPINTSTLAKIQNLQSSS